MTCYNKFLNSKFNLLKINPNKPNIQIHNYYLGVFMKNFNRHLNDPELIEVAQAPSGSRIEDYYPLVIEALNKRGNWQCLTTNQALNDLYMTFSFTNATSILTKSYGNYRFLLNSIDHYISNKASFYDKFSANDFIVKYIKLNKDNINDINNDNILNKIDGMSVILKPDKGSVSSGILVLDKFDKDIIISHIKESKYYSWTISEVFLPKLYDGYIISNRIYFLVVKINNKQVKSYFYKDFMNYRADKRFNGDIRIKEEFLTNYMDPDNPNADEIFVKTRFIPHEDWLNSFDEETQNKIYVKLKEIFYCITDTIKDDLICYNDNILKNPKLDNRYNDIIGFHIYGADALINEKGDIKIIEMNGAPAFNVKTRYYNIPRRIDYFVVMEEIIQKTLDLVYEPLYRQEKLDNFINVYDNIKNNTDITKLFYVPKSIIETYKFIFDALNSRKYITRTKNMFDDIDIFYGLRERYIVPQSSMNYYDELINYKISDRMKKAKIINKIQGITYYLASKDGLYKKMVNRYGDSYTHKMHPESIIVYYTNDKKKLYNQIKHAMHKYNDVQKWIVKPVHGSRGLGIKIFNKSFAVIENITKYIIDSSELGFDMCRKTNQYTFDGQELIIRELKKYKYWIISRYIDKPHLFKNDTTNSHYLDFITKKPTILNKKYNIRFYVLIVLDKLPTFSDLDNFDPSNNNSIMNVYLYTDYMLYFSMLNYYDDNIDEKYKNLPSNIINDMKHLTNLEMVNIVSQHVDIDPIQVKKDVTCMFSDIYKKNSPEFVAVKSQIITIVKKTINSVKNELRPLNRHENYKSCFNLLAYDSLLDEDGKLWIVEINRGPDMIGLKYNIGEVGCYEMFDEIFKLSVDKFYPDCCNFNFNDIHLFEKINIKYNIVND